MPHKQFPHLYLFGICWIFASLAGLAALLRSGQELTRRLVIMSLANSGLFGLGVAAWLWDSLSMPKLISVSIFAGLGGMSVIELFYQMLRNRAKGRKR